MSNKINKIECKNCGGVLEEETPYCPYCGHIYEPAARRVFLDRLRGYSGKMEDVGHEMKSVYKKEAGSGVKRIIHLIAVFSIILSLLFLAGILMDRLIYNSPDELRKEIAWEKEYFPALDEWYEEKEYEKILAFASQHVSDSGYSFYQWEHVEFINCYEYYKEFLEGKEHWEKTEPGEEELTHLLYVTLSLIYGEEISYHQLKEEEKELFSEWKEEAELWMKSREILAEKDWQEIEQEIEDRQYLSYDFCEKKAKELIKRRR